MDLPLVIEFSMSQTSSARFWICIMAGLRVQGLRLEGSPFMA
jgi:hypothetical protein